MPNTQSNTEKQEKQGKEVLMYRYNFTPITQGTLWQNVYISPCRYRNAGVAKSLLALLYRPNYLYKVDVNSSDLKNFREPLCREMPHLRRVWAAFGQTGGGLEAIVGNGDAVSIQYLAQLVGGDTSRKYKFVEEPLHIPRMWTNSSFWQGFARSIGLPVETEETEETEGTEGSIKLQDGGVVFYINSQCCQNQDNWECTLSFALKSNYEAFGGWGMTWKDEGADQNCRLICGTVRTVLPEIKRTIPVNDPHNLKSLLERTDDTALSDLKEFLKDLLEQPLQNIYSELIQQDCRRQNCKYEFLAYCPP